MRLRTYRTFQSMLLMGLGFYLLARFWSGRLVVYINRRFVWLVLLGAIVLLALAQVVFRNRPPVRSPEAGLLTPMMAPKGAPWRLLALLFPLVLGVFIPAQPLGSAAAEMRGVSPSLPLAQGRGAESVLEMAPEDRTMLEWLWTFDTAENPSDLEGLPASVEGFLFQDSTLPEGTVMIGRFVVTCCAADATAIGIPLLLPESADPLPTGWVRAEGRVRVVSLGDADSLLIAVESLVGIPEPEQPYLFP